MYCRLWSDPTASEITSTGCNATAGRIPGVPGPRDDAGACGCGFFYRKAVGRNGMPRHIPASSFSFKVAAVVSMKSLSFLPGGIGFATIHASARLTKPLDAPRSHGPTCFDCESSARFCISRWFLNVPSLSLIFAAPASFLYLQEPNRRPRILSHNAAQSLTNRPATSAPLADS